MPLEHRVTWRHKFRSVHWPSLAMALTTLPVVTVLLKLFGYNRLQRWLDITSPSHSTTNQRNSARDGKTAPTARAVAIAASRGPVFGTCLSRSLTLQWLLRWRQIESDLCIGVRRNEGNFQAHAWLEQAGSVINDHPRVQQQFTQLDLQSVPKRVLWR